MHLSLELDVRWPGVLRSPRRRRLAGAVVLAITLVVPTVALASHQFGDVPTGHTFHGDVSRLAGAAITAGCGDGNFCPDDSVSRGQMAAFLNRGLPRVARTNLLASVSNNTALNAGSVTITAGNVQGGYAWLYVTSTINAYATAAGCPCEATVVVARGGVQVTSQMYMDIPALPAGDADSDEIATTSNVIIVPTGVPQTLSTVFQRTGGTAPVFMYGTLIAMVIPFGGDGQPPAVRAPLADDGIGTIVGKPEED